MNPPTSPPARAASNPLSLLSAGVVALAMLACPPAPFVHGGPQSRMDLGDLPGASKALLARARPAPHLTARPSSAITGRFRPATVLSHGDDPTTGRHTLVVAVDADEASPPGAGARRVEIVYDLTPDLRIPAEPGQMIKVRFYSRAKQGRPQQRALVVTAPSGEALAVIVRHDGLPAGVLPNETVIRAARDRTRLTYSESRELSSTCSALIEHYEIEVSGIDRVSYLAPGAAGEVTIADTPFLMIAFDASRLHDERCKHEDPTHLSYALIAMTRP